MDMKNNEKSKSSGKGSIQERTRRTILDHAARLFRERGYASTSLRDIATATGMKAGSLYYHFASKEELAEEVMSQGIALVEDRVRAAIAALPEGTDPVEVIRHAMTAHLKALHDRGDYASANIRCYAHVPPDVKDRLRKVRATYEDLWAGLIAAARAAGRIRAEVDPPALRYALIGMMNWTLEWRRGASPSAEDLAAQFYAIAFAGALADG
ncbi:TetR/AcrR family transcriptional regulator [Polymorphum gilvum]|uniref:TetR family transcriptional regulator n=1 Tax=Polymorphum gilvum (strain LMG 25793 / CGMCC 1.9160 / SL003B-26A1) TaxID=991905 RepID=F2IYQ3_POLGS|nr:TetR/AcrR family transcriptional regulator [Polymorphum gilvum]ADZ69500.1 TetR family transcriptional regulator [Polymorphum gilvum SL003B-26A1]